MGITCFTVEECNKREEPVDGGRYINTIFDVRRIDTGEIIARDAHFIGGNVPVGAMWWEQYIEGFYPKSPTDHHPSTAPEYRTSNVHPSFLFSDGPCLCVLTPGGIWRIDSRASNCTMPYDYTHRCWVRHGEPPNITVDKVGVTCQAGAGSILIGGWHGFLRNGELVT